jgi:hypothetical protein
MSTVQRAEDAMASGPLGKTGDIADAIHPDEGPASAYVSVVDELAEPMSYEQREML